MTRTNVIKTKLVRTYMNLDAGFRSTVYEHTNSEQTSYIVKFYDTDAEMYLPAVQIFPTLQEATACASKIMS